MENRRGAKAVSTPGNLNAWAAMSERFGVLAWEELLEPAARLAEEGFVVDDRIAGMIAGAFDEFPDHARGFYGTTDPAGEMRPLEPGERLVQDDLARSLRRIAVEGPGAFHGGELGRAVDEVMRATDGFLRLEDLEENEAEWWDPIAIDYRGHQVLTASPPANSFPALVRLGLMSRFDVEAMGHNSADYLHLYAEATKHAFWTRLRWAGDPDVAPPPLDVLLSEGYWADTAGAFDPERSRDFEPPGVVAAEGANTTHFVVADQWGNVVSATQTLGNIFGARIMPEGTGIWLNNSLAYSTFEPAGNPMDAHPGRRKLSGDVPLFVMREGRPWIAAGTPGGHTIAQTMPQIVMNIVDFRMDIEAAIAAPRISFVEPNHLAVEEGIPEAVRAELERRGHELRARRAIGNAHGLAIEWGPHGLPVRFTGGADPRGAGLAKGY
jgi:gamma-glutamyltranspeptidase / glutathione hydrolase